MNEFDDYKIDSIELFREFYDTYFEMYVQRYRDNLKHGTHTQLYTDITKALKEAALKYAEPGEGLVRCIIFGRFEFAYSPLLDYAIVMSNPKFSAKRATFQRLIRDHCGIVGIYEEE